MPKYYLCTCIVCFCVCCVFCRYRTLWRADRSSRGLLPNVCHSVRLNATVILYTCNRIGIIVLNTRSWLIRIMTPAMQLTSAVVYGSEHFKELWLCLIQDAWNGHLIGGSHHINENSLKQSSKRKFVLCFFFYFHTYISINNILYRYRFSMCWHRPGSSTFRIFVLSLIML